MNKQLTESDPQNLREELESILHLNGCQQRTHGYNEGYDRRDIDDEHMEQLEKETLDAVIEAVEKWHGA